MDQSLTPMQVAAVLQKAANYRTDVKKASVKVDPTYDQSILLVDITFYTEGRRYQAETNFSKYLDGRTCGEILDGWIGPLPRQTLPEAFREQRGNAALVRERRRYLQNSVATVFQMLNQQRMTPSQIPKRSKFNWNAPRPTAENPSGLLTTPIPEDPVEATKQPEDPIEHVADGMVRYRGRLYRQFEFEGPYCPTERDLSVGQKLFTRCFTKAEMIAMGWDKKARAQQYRKQRGKHPDDKGDQG